MTFLELAERVLKEALRPLTVSEIWAIATEKGYDKFQKNQILEMSFRGFPPPLGSGLSGLIWKILIPLKLSSLPNTGRHWTGKPLTS
jgi:hypothetical protein